MSSVSSLSDKSKKVGVLRPVNQCGCIRAVSDKKKHDIQSVTMTKFSMGNIQPTVNCSKHLKQQQQNRPFRFSSRCQQSCRWSTESDHSAPPCWCCAPPAWRTRRTACPGWGPPSSPSSAHTAPCAPCRQVAAGGLTAGPSTGSWPWVCLHSLSSLPSRFSWGLYPFLLRVSLVMIHFLRQQPVCCPQECCWSSLLAWKWKGSESVREAKTWRVMTLQFLSCLENPSVGRISFLEMTACPPFHPFACGLKQRPWNLLPWHNRWTQQRIGASGRNWADWTAYPSCPVLNWCCLPYQSFSSWGENRSPCLTTFSSSSPSAGSAHHGHLSCPAVMMSVVVCWMVTAHPLKTGSSVFHFFHQTPSFGTDLFPGHCFSQHHPSPSQRLQQAWSCWTWRRSWAVSAACPGILASALCRGRGTS